MISPTLMPLIFAPLMLLVIWRRVRRQFGRQPIRRGRMLLRVVALSVVGAMVALAGVFQPQLLEGLLGGVLAGAALGWLGLRLTRFERGVDGSDAYIPNPWIGAVLTALLVGRLAWRLTVLAPASTIAPGSSPGMPGVGQSPLTLLVLGLLIGYYVSYYLGLLIHHRRFQRTVPPPPL